MDLRGPGPVSTSLSFRLATRVLRGVIVISFAMTAFAQSLEPVPFTAVKIEDEFWAPKLKVVRETTLPHCFRQCEETGRISNFDKAAGKIPGEHQGYVFDDSDVYKVIEGAAYALQHERDVKLEAYVNDLIARIAAAQEPDGYLNTNFTLKKEPRWTDIKFRHEMYCAGHLLEAAIAYFQATGKRALLDVSLRNVEHIMSLFGPGKRTNPPGHQELELALVKLWRLTGEKRYLDQARFFVEQRGHANGRELYGEYSQDDVPIREQTKIVGHAVRAMYYLCAVADLAAIDHDEGYSAALDRIWRDTYLTKMYVTGGLGSSAHNEGFTTQYDLPNDTAYAETCAAIASCLWNYRMNLETADARYADVLERTLYNGALSGLSISGDGIFYENPLASNGDHHRQPWFKCACCPSNLVRFIPSIANYAYATRADAVYVNLYIAGDARLKLSVGEARVRQETRYPWDGKVKLSVEGPPNVEIALALRIPEWSSRFSVAVGGAAALENPPTDRGYYVIRRKWSASDRAELTLDLTPQRVVAHPAVEADRGRVAIQRGPIVYCAEAADNPSGVRNVALVAGAEFTSEWRANLLGGVTTLRCAAQIAAPTAPDWEQPLYRRAAKATSGSLTLIPYYAWDNRKAGEMQVWFPESTSPLDGGLVSWVTPAASHCWSGDTLTALHDRLEPKDSSDSSIPRFTWWPKRGTTETVEYAFDHPRRVKGVSVYWFDDKRRGANCTAPSAWRLLARVNGEWRAVEGASEFGVALDRYNAVSFKPILTDGLRIEADLQPDLSAGLLEWKVDQAP